MRSGNTRGFTLMEAIVVTALGTVVFGLVLAAFVQTSRASEEVIAGQQMRQEALLISQGIEKVLRFRVDADQLALAPAGEARGGAEAPATPAGGVPAAGAKTSTVPKSLEDALPTTATAATPAPAAAARTPTAAELTSVPATIKPLLTTTGTAALERPVPGPGERYAGDELAVYSLSGGAAETTRLLALIRNSRGLPGEARHAYLERAAAGSGEGAFPRVEKLGGSPDRFQSSVSFRYAVGHDGLNARWQKQSERVPRLVEYTVRVWPAGTGSDFAAARTPQGRPAGFEYTSAVRLP